MYLNTYYKKIGCFGANFLYFSTICCIKMTFGQLHICRIKSFFKYTFFRILYIKKIAFLSAAGNFNILVPILLYENDGFSIKIHKFDWKNSKNSGLRPTNYLREKFPFCQLYICKKTAFGLIHIC